MGAREDYLMQDAYERMRTALLNLVGGEKAVFGIIWILMMDWIEPKGDDLEEELYKYLAQLLTGEDCLRFNFLDEEMREWQEEIRRRFAFGETFDEMGDTWNDYVVADDYRGLSGLLDALEVYFRKILPYVYRKIGEFWEGKLSGKEYEYYVTILHGSYQEQRSKMRAQIRLIRTTVDILELKQEKKLPANGII